MTDSIFAKRAFVVDGREVECRFYKPLQDNDCFFCKVEIDWPEGVKSKRAGGVDEVQALLLGMKMAHVDLLAARNVDGRTVEWLDDKSLGLPISDVIRDWDPDNHI
ncbi:hypothetical protein QE361_002175 [Sphingomonas sp. SORGH_AS802]|uniref:DUF6968 family protein n=1 Tax=unclassified Sphingomonas TaxID=196159 RepID=UPI002864E502|nr:MULTISPECIES: hypothetical protein [unclassified Sphingomonas]MDR6128619.1 hypothetical protein [Sphingomonas sp. SORGH_AS_0438]MDR6135185.1 hypothetical protein [Sphingomonas sp. SORGH_AS_0802]